LVAMCCNTVKESNYIPGKDWSLMPVCMSDITLFCSVLWKRFLLCTEIERVPVILYCDWLWAMWWEARYDLCKGGGYTLFSSIQTLVWGLCSFMFYGYWG